MAIHVLDSIPLMTHPLGRYWEQPDLSDVLIDNSHALLSPEQFEELSDYSCSIPTGVYEGKAWKRLNGEFDEDFRRRGGVPEWQLCWYGPSSDPTKCSINVRTILVCSKG